MTNEERELLLTVARLLRARISERDPSKFMGDDLAALNEALAPFEGTGAASINDDDPR